MNRLTLVLLCAVLRYSLADRCTSEKKEEYISNLSRDCTFGLIALQHHIGKDSSDYFVPTTSDLDTVCQLSCGGVYSAWLRNDCEDPYSSRMVEAMCVFTSGTTNIGKRCRSAFPDASNNLRSIFSEVLTCGIGNSPKSCPPNCRVAMNNLIDTLGCCSPVSSAPNSAPSFLFFTSLLVVLSLATLSVEL